MPSVMDRSEWRDCDDRLGKGVDYIGRRCPLDAFLRIRGLHGYDGDVCVLQHPGIYAEPGQDGSGACDHLGDLVNRHDSHHGVCDLFKHQIG